MRKSMILTIIMACSLGCSLTPPGAEKNQNRTRALDLVEQGQALEKQNQYRPAIQRYLQARDLYPTAQVYHRLGHSYAQLNDLETARHYLQSAVELAPDNEAAFYELTHVEEQMKAGGSAAATMPSQRMASAPPVAPLAPLAESPMTASGFPVEEEPAGPVHEEVRLSDVYQTLFGSGNQPTASVTTERAGPTFLSDAQFHVNKARGYLAGGRTDMAVAEYKEAIALDPKNAKLRVELAEVLKLQGETDSSQKELLEALKVNPKNPDAIVQLSDTKNVGKYSEQTQRVIEEASKTGANDAEAQITLGDLYMETEEQEKASEHYQRAHQLEPNSPKPLWKLGNLRRDVGDLAQAKRFYLEALKRDPKFIPALNNLAYMADNAGQYTQSREYLEAIIKADPTWAKAYFNLGVLHETRFNDPAKAIEYYEKYLQIGGDLEQKARDNIAALRAAPAAPAN